MPKTHIENQNRRWGMKSSERKKTKKSIHTHTSRNCKRFFLLLSFCFRFLTVDGFPENSHTLLLAIVWICIFVFRILMMHAALNMRPNSIIQSGSLTQNGKNIKSHLLFAQIEQTLLLNVLKWSHEEKIHMIIIRKLNNT